MRYRQNKHVGIIGIKYTRYIKMENPRGFFARHIIEVVNFVLLIPTVIRSTLTLPQK